MPAKNVTVLDQSGSLLSSNKEGPNATWMLPRSNMCGKSNRITSSASKPFSHRWSAPKTCMRRSPPILIFHRPNKLPKLLGRTNRLIKHRYAASKPRNREMAAGKSGRRARRIIESAPGSGYRPYRDSGQCSRRKRLAATGSQHAQRSPPPITKWIARSAIPSCPWAASNVFPWRWWSIIAMVDRQEWQDHFQTALATARKNRSPRW